MENSTATQILETARHLVRSRGYSAFSYADIANRVGIRKASIHYHFPAKEALVVMLVQRYREDMAKARDRIAGSRANPDQQMRRFAQLYRDGLDQKQICLCAMLAADFAVLPSAVQAEIRAYFQQTEVWLTYLLHRGQETQGWSRQLATEQEAAGIIAMLQGAQLLARSFEDGVAAFERVVHPLLAAQYRAG
ncbi:MAG: TetR/AcrR family transcriptional regulator [Cyanobacteria bacterium P01_A01_bin.135]